MKVKTTLKFFWETGSRSWNTGFKKNNHKQKSHYDIISKLKFYIVIHILNEFFLLQFRNVCIFRGFKIFKDIFSNILFYQITEIISFVSTYV